MVEQLLAQLRRQIGLAVEEQGGDVVLQRALAAALVVEEQRLPVAQHDVARLEIAIEKIIVIGAEQKLGQAAEIVLQRLLVEGNAGQAQKVILEIVQVPGDGLAVEAVRADSRPCNSDRGPPPPESAAARPPPCDRLQWPAERWPSPARLPTKKLEERGVAQVFFQVGALAQILRINLRNRQSVAAKMPGKLQERDVLLAHGIENADGARSPAGEPDDGAPRAAELALKRLHMLRPATGNAARKAVSERP